VRQIIEFFRKLRKWLPLVLRWLIIEPKIFWFTLLPFIFSGVFIWIIPAGILNNSIFCDTLEKRFQFMGLFLELSGIVLVVYGLNKTLKLYLGKHLFHFFPKWIKRFPKFGGLPIISGYMNARENGYDTCQAVVTTSPPPDMSVENRVELLEKQYQKVWSQVQSNRFQFENEIKKLSDGLIAERKERERGDLQAQHSLKEFALGDVQLELMGVIWLFSGAIFATASTELALLFQSFIR
jgi:hypothetical protein